MPFIPHTAEETKAMLAEIGVNSIADLFAEIPENLRLAKLNINEGLTEMQANRYLQQQARQDEVDLNFIGAGAYEHHIPAAVWEIATRGEFMTAYTPYQAEASQGTLQLLYEYQTMLASLTGMDVSNASLYEGASAVAEAVLMAVRANRHCHGRKVLVPASLHPHYRQVLHTILSQQKIEIINLAFTSEGVIDNGSLAKLTSADCAALIIPQPNFFGILENVDELTDFAHAHNMLAIAVVNPTSLALLKPPGQWGKQGADIACGEGQALGVPLASGGPYFGFMCCKSQFVRQMPGRIIGCTVDKEGKRGFSLTLQAREQHIRRAKATSNICTNQGLMVTAATIYLSLLGPHGLRQVASACHANTAALLKKLLTVAGVSQVFDQAFFHEIVIKVPAPAAIVLARLAARGIHAGIALEDYYPQLKDCVLLCATETKTPADLELLTTSLREVLSEKLA